MLPSLLLPKTSYPGFIAEVFGNLNQILTHHQRLLAALFARQREQPSIRS